MTAATYRGERAIYNGYQHRSTFIDGSPLKVGMCLKWTRQMGGIPREFEYAYQVWTHCPSRYRHVTASAPPRGSVALYRSPNTSGLPGHIAWSLGGGNILSTDLPTGGKVGIVNYMDPVRKWGHSYVGYTTWVNSRTLWCPTIGVVKLRAVATSGGWGYRYGTTRVEYRLFKHKFLAWHNVNGYWAKSATGDAWAKACKWMGDPISKVPNEVTLKHFARRAPYMIVVP